MHIFNTSVPSLSFTDLSLLWADGTPCFNHLSGTFPPGITGLIGDNGSGKSSLLKVLAGLIEPSSGKISVPDAVAYLPQDLALSQHSTIAELFGIAEVLSALDAIEAGEYDPELYDIIGEQWDIAEKTLSTLASAGFEPAKQEQSQTLLTRPLTEFSGGEAVTAAVVALLQSAPDVVLLDEPTNNLDSTAKARLIHLLEELSCPAIVVSHDRDLLMHVDQIAELYEGNLRFFAGNFEVYRAALDTEQDAAERHVREAKADERRQKRERIEAETKIARAEQAGKKAVANKKKAPLALGLDKMSAQRSYAKTRQVHQNRLDSADAARREAESKVREYESIYLDLPGTSLPVGKKVLELQKSSELKESDDLPEQIIVAGPERWRIAGENGSGKSTLIQEILGVRASSAPVPVYRAEYCIENVGYLPQRIELETGLNMLEMVGRANPMMNEQQIRDALARLLFRRDRVLLPSEALSGGERFRVALAQILLAEPAPQLLILDEPTNNLDMTSVDWLVSALKNYEGALLLVSHDEYFCEQLEVQALVELAPREIPIDSDDDR